MRENASGRWSDDTWDEVAVAEHASGKVTRSAVATSWTGGLEGSGALVYVMAYSGENVVFRGFELVTGRLGGRTGSFVLEHEGTFADGVARATLSVVAGSGTGELTGLRGTGSVEATHGGPNPYGLSFELVGAVPSEV